MSSYPPDDYPPPDRRPDDYPADARRPGDARPDAYPPEPAHPDPYAAPPNAVSGRVVPPAITLLVAGVINLLLGLGGMGFGVMFSQMPPQEFEKAFERQNPQALNDLRRQGWSVQDLLNIYTYTGLGGGGVNVFVSLLTIFGAIRMMMLRSYGLAVFVSVLTAIPCISFAACPCPIGMGVGIWALVVLLNPEVRAAFR